MFNEVTGCFFCILMVRFNVFKYKIIITLILFCFFQTTPSISLELKFIGASKARDEIIGKVKILKKTKTLVFLFCELKCNDTIITSASGVWKILKIEPSKLGPGG